MALLSEDMHVRPQVAIWLCSCLRCAHGNATGHQTSSDVCVCVCACVCRSAGHDQWHCFFAGAVGKLRDEYFRLSPDVQESERARMVSLFGSTDNGVAVALSAFAKLPAAERKTLAAKLAQDYAFEGIIGELDQASQAQHAAVPAPLNISAKVKRPVPIASVPHRRTDIPDGIVAANALKFLPWQMHNRARLCASILR